MALPELGSGQPHRPESCSLPNLPDVGRVPSGEIGTRVTVHFLKTSRKTLQSMGPGQEPSLSRSEDRSVPGYSEHFQNTKLFLPHNNPGVAY